MRAMLRPLTHAALAAALFTVLAPAGHAGAPLHAATLARLAPDADRGVLALALGAMRCAQNHGIAMDAERLAVIDYRRPSLEPRLWVFDLTERKLLYEEHVAHGQGSGDNFARRFSNRSGSHESSLGLFVTGGTYTGRNGYSLRMQGLEAGVNDQAQARAIVMHGASYVDPHAGHAMGRLGRSWGCPAVRNIVAQPMIDTLKGGQFVFAYYPDEDWLRRSSFLHCGAVGTQTAAGRRAVSETTEGRPPLAAPR